MDVRRRIRAALNPGGAEKTSATTPAGKDDKGDDATREGRRNDYSDDKDKEAEEKSAGSDGTNEEIVDKVGGVRTYTHKSLALTSVLLHICWPRVT